MDIAIGSFIPQAVDAVGTLWNDAFGSLGDGIGEITHIFDMIKEWVVEAETVVGTVSAIVSASSFTALVVTAESMFYTGLQVADVLLIAILVPTTAVTYVMAKIFGAGSTIDNDYDVANAIIGASSALATAYAVKQGDWYTAAGTGAIAALFLYESYDTWSKLLQCFISGAWNPSTPYKILPKTIATPPGAGFFNYQTNVQTTTPSAFLSPESGTGGIFQWMPQSANLNYMMSIQSQGVAAFLYQDDMFAAFYSWYYTGNDPMPPTMVSLPTYINSVKGIAPPTQTLWPLVTLACGDTSQVKFWGELTYYADANGQVWVDSPGFQQFLSLVANVQGKVFVRLYSASVSGTPLAAPSVSGGYATFGVHAQYVANTNLDYTTLPLFVPNTKMGWLIYVWSNVSKAKPMLPPDGLAIDQSLTGAVIAPGGYNAALPGTICNSAQQMQIYPHSFWASPVTNTKAVALVVVESQFATSFVQGRWPTSPVTWNMQWLACGDDLTFSAFNTPIVSGANVPGSQSQIQQGQMNFFNWSLGYGGTLNQPTPVPVADQPKWAPLPNQLHAVYPLPPMSGKDSVAAARFDYMQNPAWIVYSSAQYEFDTSKQGGLGNDFVMVWNTNAVTSPFTVSVIDINTPTGGPYPALNSLRTVTSQMIYPLPGIMNGDTTYELWIDVSNALIVVSNPYASSVYGTSVYSVVNMMPLNYGMGETTIPHVGNATCAVVFHRQSSAAMDFVMSVFFDVPSDPSSGVPLINGNTPQLTNNVVSFNLYGFMWPNGTLADQYGGNLVKNVGGASGSVILSTPYAYLQGMSVPSFFAAGSMYAMRSFAPSVVSGQLLGAAPSSKIMNSVIMSVIEPIVMKTGLTWPVNYNGPKINPGYSNVFKPLNDFMYRGVNLLSSPGNVNSFFGWNVLEVVLSYQGKYYAPVLQRNDPLANQTVATIGLAPTSATGPGTLMWIYTGRTSTFGVMGQAGFMLFNNANYTEYDNPPAAMDKQIIWTGGELWEIPTVTMPAPDGSSDPFAYVSKVLLKGDANALATPFSLANSEYDSMFSAPSDVQASMASYVMPLDNYIQSILVAIGSGGNQWALQPGHVNAPDNTGVGMYVRYGGPTPPVPPLVNFHSLTPTTPVCVSGYPPAFRNKWAPVALVLDTIYPNAAVPTNFPMPSGIMGFTPVRVRFTIQNSDGYVALSYAGNGVTGTWSWASDTNGTGTPCLLYVYGEWPTNTGGPNRMQYVFCLQPPGTPPNTYLIMGTVRDGSISSNKGIGFTTFLINQIPLKGVEGDPHFYNSIGGFSTMANHLLPVSFTNAQSLLSYPIYPNDAEASVSSVGTVASTASVGQKVGLSATITSNPSTQSPSVLASAVGAEIFYQCTPSAPSMKALLASRDESRHQRVPGDAGGAVWHRLRAKEKRLASVPTRGFGSGL